MDKIDKSESTMILALIIFVIFLFVSLIFVDCQRDDCGEKLDKCSNRLEVIEDICGRKE